MQVLYQLSYGPVWIDGASNVGGSLVPGRWTRWALPFDAESLHRRGPELVAVHTWRHTATSLPCTDTCSASTTIGS